MAQGNGNAASEAAQAAQAAAAAAAAAASNPTLIQHMTNFGGRAHHEAELNLSQNSNPGNGSENPDHMNPGHIEEEDRARCLRSYAASGGPGTYPHPHELHPGYDPMDPSDFERTYQQRPVDLGYNRSYSPNPVAAIAASATVSEGWTHPLAVTNSDWIDSRVGQHAGIPWPPHSHDQRYVPTATSMKWETISNSGVGVGGPGSAVSGLSGVVGVGCYKKIKKVGSPGGPGPHDQDGDETLQHLTVKELNKRVQNLPRDEVVALKQRRRTLKNRGYAMNCRLRRQENREKLEHQVKILTDKLNQVSHERDYFRAQWEKLQHLHATAVAANASRSSSLNGAGQHAENLHMGGQGQLDLSMSGTAAAAAAQAHHEDYKRDNYQNNNDLKIGSIRRF